MKQRSLFYQATYAMFLMSLAIMTCVVVVTFLGRAMGGNPSEPGIVYGTRTVSRAMVAEALGSIEQGKQLDNGLVALKSDDYDMVSIIQTRHDETPIGFFCGSTRSYGYSILDGLLYKGTAYNLYYKFDESTGSTSELLTGASIVLSTGEEKHDILEQDLPPLLTTLTDNQLYGDDELPEGVTRLNASWYDTLNAPATAIVTSEDCMGVMLGNVGAVTLFGLLFGIAWVIERKRNASVN
jgi:hypothetical protein